MSDEAPEPIDPSQYPGFLPVYCAHGRLTAWVSTPPTYHPPPVEACEDCVVVVEDPAA